MGGGMMINRAPPLQSPCNPMGAAEQQPGDIPLPTYSHGLGCELQPPSQLCLAAVRGGSAAMFRRWETEGGRKAFARGNRYPVKSNY